MISDRMEINGRENLEVTEKPMRRQFDAAFTLRILEEADRCSEPDQIGELLRREGLYSSHLTKWRRRRQQGTLQSRGSDGNGELHI